MKTLRTFFTYCIYAYLFISLFSDSSYASSFQFSQLNPSWTYTNYTEGVNKLASNVCYKLILDDEGYIWVATDMGLQVYNGKTFDPIDLPGSDGEIVCLYKDGPYLIGMSYYGDIIYIHTRTRKVCLLRDHDPPWDYPNNMFKTFIRLNDKRLYFLRYFGASFSLPDQDFYSNQKDKFKHLKLLGSKGIHQNIFYQSLKERFFINDTTLLSKVRDYFKGMPLHKIIFHDNSMSIGQHYLFNPATGSQLPRWQFYSNTSTTKEDYILSSLSFPDEEWISWRFYGLERLRQGQAGYYAYAHLFKGLCITSMIKDSQDNIWMSTLSNGLLRIKTNTKELDYISCSDRRQYYSSDIHYIRRWGDTLCLGYRHPVVDILHKGKRLWRYTGDTVTDNSKTNMFFGHGGGPGYLISAEGNLYTVPSLNKPGILKETVIKDAYPWQNDAIAVAKRTFYYKIDGATMQLDTVNIRVAEISTSNLVLAMCNAYPDSGWYIANSQGLFLNNNPVDYGSSNRILQMRNYEGNILIVNSREVLFKQPGQYRFISLKKMQGKDVRQIAWDTLRKQLYLLSSDGLLRYSPDSRQEVLFLSNAELPQSTKMNCVHIDSSEVWIGTSNGIFHVNKDKLQNQLSYDMRLVPADHKSNRSLSDTLEYTYSGKLDIPLNVDILDYNNDRYNITYVIYDEQNREFRRGTSNNDRILNPGLFQPGRYNIRIRAFQRKGFIEKEITLMIHPLWWQRTWVQLSSILLLLTTVALVTAWIIRRRNKSMYIRLKKEHELLLVKNKLQSSRLKPHFIFNALNPLQKYILEDNKDAALQYFEQFSKLMRNSIKHFEIDFISLEEELIFLDQYIYVQQCRYPGRFTFTKDLNLIRKAGAVYIPAMILQPILENAIEHGFSQEDLNIHNYIGFSVREDNVMQQLIIIIENSGSTFPEQLAFNENHGMGIVVHKIALVAAQFNEGTINFKNGEMGAQCKIILSLDATRNRN